MSWVQKYEDLTPPFSHIFLSEMERKCIGCVMILSNAKLLGPHRQLSNFMERHQHLWGEICQKNTSLYKQCENLNSNLSCRASARDSSRNHFQSPPKIVINVIIKPTYRRRAINSPSRLQATLKQRPQKQGLKYYFSIRGRFRIEAAPCLIFKIFFKKFCELLRILIKYVGKINQNYFLIRGRS